MQCQCWLPYYFCRNAMCNWSCMHPCVCSWAARIMGPKSARAKQLKSHKYLALYCFIARHWPKFLYACAAHSRICMNYGDAQKAPSHFKLNNFLAHTFIFNRIEIKKKEHMQKLIEYAQSRWQCPQHTHVFLLSLRCFVLFLFVAFEIFLPLTKCKRART